MAPDPEELARKATQTGLVKVLRAAMKLGISETVVRRLFERALVAVYRG